MSTRLTVERFAPAALAAACAALWWAFDMRVPGDVSKEMLAAVLSAAAICAGFLTTAMTVLMSLGGSAVGRRLARRNQLGLLSSYLRSAIYGCVALSFCSLIAFFFIESAGIARSIAALLVGVGVYAGAAFIRIVVILAHVMEQLAQPEDLNG